MNIVIDASTVACATDFTVSMTKDMITTACLSSTGAKETVPDMYGWTVTGSGLVFRTTSQTAGSYGVMEIAHNLLVHDTSVSVQIVPDVSLNQYFSGAGYFSSLNYTGGVGAAVTYDFEVTGTGVLSILTTA
jgi:predicted secreted protein